MWLRSLTVTDFRCHRQASIDLAPGGNAIVGDNGVGKTSLLEAAYLLSRTLSFRGSPPTELIRHGATHALVVGMFQRHEQATRVAVQRERSASRIRVDHANDVSVQALARLLPIQVMDPRTHRVVEDGPVYRRRVMDWGVFHVEHSFISAWGQYQRVLRQRNAACRRADRGQVRAWNQSYLQAATRVDAMRRAHLDAVSRPWRDAVRWLLGDEHSPQLGYRPGWPSDMTLEDALARGEERELQVGHTVVGPHRADLSLRMDGRQVRHQASRGQQKALVLALLIAQAAEVARAHGDTPILLIDDFGAEWGAPMRQRAAAALDATGCQWVGTWLDEPDAGLPIEQVFHVEHGPEGPVIN